jgi:hypothetical protein
MRRLLAAGLLPGRSGQPVKVWAHISLAGLMRIEGSSALLQEWTANLRARWAGHRAAAAEAGGRQGLWLDGDDAEAIACDAVITPVVAGNVNPAAFDDLVRLCVQLDRLRHGIPPGTATGQDDADGQGCAGGTSAGTGADVSNPEVPAAGRDSLPLDIGYSSTVPAGIRNAVRHRALHCEWAGRCDQPAAACQVHHTKHKANGGKTSLTGCVLLCAFHHQVMIHRLGWTLIVNPDGTTTAWNKDKTKILHSHGPPARAG